MKCPECGKNHLVKVGLPIIWATKTWSLVYNYMVLAHEICLSMRDDAVQNRKGAFITRLRDYKECYFKGLWAGLIASSVEIVHDASGERPWHALANLEKKVSKVVFNEDSVLSAHLAEPGEVAFKAMDFLNTSTHVTALFLLQLSKLDDTTAKSSYERVLKNVETEVAHLKYTSEALQAGKSQSDIIDGIRSMRTRR